MMKTSLACIAISATLAMVVFGCNPSDQKPPATVIPNFNDVVFLTTDSCLAPCWQGLHIGVSTKNEVMAAISRLKFVDQKAIRVIPQSVPDLNPENWVQGDNIVVVCTNRVEPCMRLTIANDKLRDIDIELDRGLTLEKVINHFGDPDYVGSHRKGGDVIDCRIELIWIKQQLVLYSTFFTDLEDVQNSCYAVDENGSPSAKLEIAEVRYLPLEDINKRIEDHQFAEYVGTK